MSSPFPGVDPYIEPQGFWPDFHASFITYLRDALADQLPSNYEARIDERVNLVELPAEKLRRYRFAFPPMSEQLSIVRFLDDVTGKLDALTAEAEHAIDLLQERRTALICATVTGKIDVRGLVQAVTA